MSSASRLACLFGLFWLLFWRELIRSRVNNILIHIRSPPARSLRTYIRARASSQRVTDSISHEEHIYCPFSEVL